MATLYSLGKELMMTKSIDETTQRKISELINAVS